MQTHNEKQVPLTAVVAEDYRTNLALRVFLSSVSLLAQFHMYDLAHKDRNQGAIYIPSQILGQFRLAELR